VTARSWRILLLVIGLALALTAAAIAVYLLQGKPAPRLTLTPAQYDQLFGWREYAVAAAIPAFLKSCAATASRSAAAALDGRTKSGDFGTAGEWGALCAAAEKLPAGDDKAAREFFETAFVPMLAGNNGDSNGLFTGYFEITLNGSRRRGGAVRLRGAVTTRAAAPARRDER
jgi:membrane-bound lytic murein transglycosylase A